LASPRKSVVGAAVLGAVALFALLVIVFVGGDDTGERNENAALTLDDIPADCSRPVDADLNRLVASAPDGSTFRLRPGGCYGIDQAVVLSGKNDFTFDGAGAAIKALTPGGEQRANIDIRRGRNVAVTNVTVEGAFPGPSPDGGPGNGPRDGNRTGTQHGVYVRSVQGAKVTKVRSLNNGGECVAVMSDFDPVQGFVGGPSRDVVIEELDCRHTGRQGVAIIDAEQVVLRKSYIADAHDCAIDIETDIDSQVTRQILIEDNTFGVSRFAVICNGGQGHSPAVADITVARNTMTVPPATCFGPVFVQTPPHHQAAGFTRTGYTFVGNTFRTISYAFLLSGVSDVEISGNTVEGGLPGSPGCSDFTVSPALAQPAVDARNVHGLTGSGNVWLGYQEVVRADAASSDVGSLTGPTPPP